MQIDNVNQAIKLIQNNPKANQTEKDFAINTINKLVQDIKLNKARLKSAKTALEVYKAFSKQK